MITEEEARNLHMMRSQIDEMTRFFQDDLYALNMRLLTGAVIALGAWPYLEAIIMKEESNENDRSIAPAPAAAGRGRAAET